MSKISKIYYPVDEICSMDEKERFCLLGRRNKDFVDQLDENRVISSTKRTKYK